MCKSLAGILCLLTVLCASPVLADLQLVVRSGVDYDDVDYVLFNEPAINNSGVVAFGGRGRGAGYGYGKFRRTSPSAAIEILGSSGRDGLGGQGWISNNHDINAGGAAVFRSNLGDGTPGVYRSNGPLEVIDERGDLSRFSVFDSPAGGINFTDPALNASGTVVYTGGIKDEPGHWGVAIGDGSLANDGLRNEIVVRSGVAYDQLGGIEFIQSSQASTLGVAPDINDSGTILFDGRVTLNDKVLAIRRADGSMAKIAETGSGEGQFSGIGRASLNNSEEVLFFGDRGDLSGFFLNTVDSSSFLASMPEGVNLISNYAFTDEGTYAFHGFYANGQEGIFVGNGGNIEEVIRTGQFIDGARVDTVNLGRRGYSENGWLTFHVSHPDFNAIYRTQVIASGVPEPGVFGLAFLSIGLMIPVALIRKRLRQRVCHTG